MKITMDGEYAFEGMPCRKVRILCVDAPGDYPVIGLYQDGCTFRRKADGTFRIAGYGLIPLQRKPREFWVNVYSNVWRSCHTTEEDALAAPCTSNGLAKTIRVREVLE